MSTTKLYPPVINGTIPAFYDSSITVPFEENKTVSEYDGFALKIKTVQSNRLIGTYFSTTNTFTNINTSLLNEGQYYKVQLAYYIGNEVPGFYSTVGVTKYTTKPTVEILKNTDGVSYFGIYNQEGKDITEKVYSYQFDLKDNKGNIVETSNEQLHNSSFDTESYESIDSFTITRELEKNQMYYLTYKVTTINGLEVISPALQIFRSESVDSNLLSKADLDVQLNYEDGYIDISLKKPEGVEKEESVVGSFYLLRASSEDNFKSWDEVLNFVLSGQQPSRHLWKDMTIKQGVSYKYAVQQYNDYQLRTNKIESKTIYADFEHAYLFDGDRQLKIKFDPKVSSFKNTVLEQKVDTIGSKYPFIFKNGNVRYKEFSVAGLISLLSDENNLFFELGNDNEDFRQTSPAEKVLAVSPIRTTQLTPQNIYNERNFKLEALEWLTNGEPKLFRSPVEGNYIVRLLNVSLSPNDVLGRMLHTFSATAYEIAEYNYENLSKYEILKTSDPSTQQLRWKTIKFPEYPIQDGVNILGEAASAIRLEGMIAGDKIQIATANGEVYKIVIGTTGSYIVDLDKGIEIKSLSFIDSDDTARAIDGTIRHQGTLTYAYYSKSFIDSFDTINKIELVQYPSRQFVGAQDNIIALINDGIKNKLQSIGYIRFIMRDSDEKLYQQVDEKGNITYSSDVEGSNPIIPNVMGLNLYEVYDKEDNLLYLLDGYNGEKYEISENPHEATSLWINESEESIDLWDIYQYEIRNFSEEITSIKTGHAVITEITYQAKELTYDLENTNEQVKEAQTALDAARNKTDYANAYERYNAILEAQNNYIAVLGNAIDEAERR